MLCVLILYINGGTYSLKSIPNDRFFGKLSIAILFTLRVLAKNLLRGNHLKKLFVFCFDVWLGSSNPGFTSTKSYTQLTQKLWFVFLDIWRELGLVHKFPHLLIKNLLIFPKKKN